MSSRCICGQTFNNRSAKIRHKKKGKCPERDNKMQFKDLPKDLPKDVSRDTQRELLDIIGEYFSDGAYFALAEELGVEF